jgi:kynureninase
VRLMTPREPSRRGCQVSLRLIGVGREVQKALQEARVVCDFREPDVLRVAPTPLYNTHHDVWRFADGLQAILP